jgi:hypothetical protein
MHVTYKRGGWLGRVRTRCARCRKFIITNREYNATGRSGELNFSSYSLILNAMLVKAINFYT